MPFNLGLPELVIIAFLAILFFGRDKLSDLARGTADAVKEFRTAFKDEEEVKPKKKKTASTSKKKSVVSRSKKS